MYCPPLAGAAGDGEEVVIGQSIGEILPFAIGVALSPVPIIAVILMLFSERARSNGPAFLAGWIVGLTAVCTVVLLIADGADVATGEPSDTTSIVKLLLGILAVLLGFKQWRGRPKEGEEAPMPKWMSKIDTFTAPKALGLGILLSAINPKNLIFAVGAAATIAQAGLSVGDEAVVVFVFVALASLTIAGPVGLYLFGGPKVKTTLDGWKVWLGANNAAVMSVLFVVIGFVLVGKGISGLSA